jgi:hypothetical protein
MKTGRGISKKPGGGGYLLLAIVFSIGVLHSVCRAADVPPAPARPSKESFLLGERMYRDGLLPSGAPMEAVIKGDVSVDGTMFTCVSCHLRGGIGSYEGQIATPPTNGKVLYAPRPAGFVPSGEEGVKYTLPARPAYTDETLATSLRDGFDPTGRELDFVMPRYLLDTADMAVMISYLKQLSYEFSPGASEKLITFATIIAGDVSPEDRSAVLVPMDAILRSWNARNAKSELMARKGERAGSPMRLGRKFRILRWELKGPPESWPGQLEEYDRKEPVFAILGGISDGEWKPIHEFCESHRIPCLFPVTDAPVISSSDWYTLYFSKGVYQEGEAAARYLEGTEGSPVEKPVVQVFREGRDGAALAAGFRETWEGLGHRPPVDKILRAGDPFPWELIEGANGQGRPDVLLLWLGAEGVPVLERLADNPNRPPKIFVSSSLQGKNLWSFPEKTRGFTYVTWPWRLPQDEKRFTAAANVWVRNPGGPADEKRISTRVYSLMRLVSEVMMHVGTNYYRDTLLDAVGMEGDKDEYPDYVRLSFGPGQRYASKGCYIVQLAPGPSPGVESRSDWITH